MYTVKDGQRLLQFNGKRLAESSSWRDGSTRWIEFQLYKTENGSYILSRVGASTVFHGAACPLVERYKLVEAEYSSLSNYAVPCLECQPTEEASLVFPEKYRYWAQVSEEPAAVLEALYKYDNSGARYLTNVAQRLLESAVEKDEKLASVYKIELIP